MAGHSKFANIKHRKGAQDKKRGKVFTKLIKEIMVGVKEGGPDPDANPRLRLAIQNAKGANMPKDNVDRAIKKASGEGGQNYIENTYEGYGVDGIAFFIECATDNNTRTVANIRSYFNKHGGNLGKDGCLEFIFNRKGVFILNSSGLDEDDFTMDMIDAGAEDVEFDEEFVNIICEVEDFGNISKKLAELQVEPIEAGLQRIPITFKQLTSDTMPAFTKLLDVIEDDDDVQKVYHNVENLEDME
ncbi:MAG: YebC/PmpR family DNA-binding transcriptional regulator [Epsilonproteobacteria bacterium]|nr:MAG: YebC/PmpR family DNA-binding transcriptional regulator [Campylobacterota bacterium]RLA64860.1 MAG: YebC/PmpR family DNA-binding transcriptional regulator [Campylobacterota bacterium]